MGTTPHDIIAKAKSQIGTKESPYGSNRTKYGAWYGMNGQPWCAMFVSWVYAQSGVPLHISTPKGFAYVPSGEAWAKTHSIWVAKPSPGDIPIYDFGAGIGQHTGIFEEMASDSSFYAIEGNTSGTGSQDNGGEVCRKTRYLYQVRGFINASTVLDKPLPKPQPEWEGDNGRVGHPLLRKGDHQAQAVEHLQGRLLHHDFNIRVDGVFGDHTESDVREFQHRRGIYVDGIVGHDTWAALHH